MGRRGKVRGDRLFLRLVDRGIGGGGGALVYLAFERFLRSGEGLQGTTAGAGAGAGALYERGSKKGKSDSDISERERYLELGRRVIWRRIGAK